MEAPTRDEREAYQSILDLAAEGREPPAEVIDRWIRERRERAALLDERPPEEAQAALAAELREIETRLTRLEEGDKASRGEAFREVLETGARLRWALWLADLLTEEPTVDPLALVDEELRRVELRKRNLTRLDARLEESALGPGDRVDREKLRLLRSRLERFVRVEPRPEREGPLEAAAGHWLAAGEAFHIEHDIQQAEGEGESFGEGLEELRARRRRHLEACAGELERSEPEEALEFFRSSLADVLDQVSIVISEGDLSSPPRRLAALDLALARLDSLVLVLGERRDELCRRGVLAPEDRRSFRRGLKQLARTRRQVLRAETEATVNRRLETTFGRRQVRVFENILMVLIFALVGLVFFEWRLMADLPLWLESLGLAPAGSLFSGVLALETLKVFYLVDLLFCIVFQTDFLVRWAFAGWGRSYFVRHFFFESLPALPYGFFFHHLGLLEARSIIVVRILRLRGTLTLRAFLLVFMRLFRVVTFFARGVDRAVEKFRGVLDRDVVVFDDEPPADAPESPVRRKALGLETRRQKFLENFWTDIPWGERGDLLSRHAILLGAEARMSTGLALPYRRGVVQSRGEVRIERVIYDFLDCDVTRVMGTLGREGVERTFRWLRFLDIPGFRNAPVIRRLVPAARMLNPAEAVSFAVNAVGQVLQELLGVFRFWSDLSGITTGPQVLDRVGTTMIAASRRPAVRLLFAGSLFLLVEALFTMLRFEVLGQVSSKLSSILGLPILLLGSICLVVLVLGRWLKRISGEALDQYLRTADAQFYPLVKARKFLRFDEHIDLLHRSAFLPEVRLRSGSDVSKVEWKRFLSAPVIERARFMPGRNEVTDETLSEFAEDRETIVLLYRDFLDGPVLHRSDDKTSMQLLGNLVLRNIRARTLALSAKELRHLERLSLEKGSLITLGPYFWFRFITESLAIETAKLITEYNSTCIPLAHLHLASPEARRRLEEFLEDHRETSGAPRKRESRGRAERSGETLTSATFTAFDFLGPTAESDEVVRTRYGDEVLAALRRDRKAVVRDIFGTRPYHLLPRHQRALNPYRLYKKYLAGAKFFLLPIVFTAALLRLKLAGIRQLMELVEEVLGRKKTRRTHLSRFAGFDVAVRKINRMRKPLFMEALRLRAAVDVEYLGLRLPGQPRPEGAAPCEAHLDFIGAIDSERRPIEKLRGRAMRDLRRFRRFFEEKALRGGSLETFLERLDPTGKLRARKGEVLRALVTAFVTDHDDLRSVLTAPDWARSFFEKVLRTERTTLVSNVADGVACGLFVFLPRHRRRRRIFREFLRLHPDLQGLEPRVRRRVLARLLRADGRTERMLAFALRNLRHEEEAGECAIMNALERTARDYKVWTRKLVTVRTIQTLTVLDIRTYRDLVHEVGDYGSDGRRGR